MVSSAPMDKICFILATYELISKGSVFRRSTKKKKSDEIWRQESRVGGGGGDQKMEGEKNNTVT